eukprot:TRINITY_DN6008_c0_g1_i1.p1 TRINITY_DN6008_c0_g1~~TRINITY_DN6008_c0_g1_i1.p1  ORF type:complete len:205 (-),score=28.95 TRINITY_DN6008_c0_g1_i1:440-1054(-)
MESYHDGSNVCAAGSHLQNAIDGSYDANDTSIGRCSESASLLWLDAPVSDDEALIAVPATSLSSCQDTSPSRRAVEQHSDIAKLAPGDTTIMVRDLPCKVGYERMMAELKSGGLDGLYDYIYFPTSHHQKNAFKGFCFINFMTPEALELFANEFANYQFEEIRSAKVVRFDRARVQGREANVALLESGSKRLFYLADPDGLRAA